MSNPNFKGSALRIGSVPAVAACLACFLMLIPDFVGAQSCTPGEPTYYEQGAAGSSSLVSLEAELYTSRTASRKEGHGSNVTWTVFSDPMGSNASFINVPTVNQDALHADELGAEVSYDITFQETGTHYLWMRVIAPDNDARSFHLYFDGQLVRDDVETDDGFEEWRWEKIAHSINVSSPGVHRLTIRHREDGLKLDKLVLTKNNSFTPTGYGPEATAIRSYVSNNKQSVKYHVDHHTGHGFAVVETEHPTYEMYGIGDMSCLNWSGHVYGSASNDSISQVNTTGRIATPATVWGSPRIEFEIYNDRTEELFLFLRHRGTEGNSSVNVRVNNGQNRFFDLSDSPDHYIWESIALGSVVPDSSGKFLLSILMHEDGTPIDKILVTTDKDYAPRGEGALETILNPKALVYHQKTTQGYPVELPMEAPSQNLGGFYGFSGLEWSNANDRAAKGGRFATVQSPGGGRIEATGDETDLAPAMEYEIEFTETGVHYIYTRHNTQSDLHNSFAYYLDGKKVGDHEIPVSDPDQWLFAPQAPEIHITTPGRHTFAVAMRESGSRFDHMVISRQPGGSALALPAELLFFQGRVEGGLNVLTWATSRESNTSTHVIERSEDGSKTWTSVGTVTAAGNSDESKFYEFRDKDGEDKAFYRIRTVDMNGGVDLSSVVCITRKPERVEMSLYPNTTSGFATLEFKTVRSEDITLEVYNIHGRMLAVKSLHADRGMNTVEIPVKGFPKGTYLVSTKISEELYARQMVIN